MKACVAALAMMSVTSIGLASERVGELSDVHGNVTVTSDATVVRGKNGTSLAANSRIVTGNGSKATVRLTEGCVIALKANQFLALNPKLTCTQHVAAVSQLASPVQLAQAGGGGIVAGAAGGAGGAVVVGVSVASFVVLDQVVSSDLSGT